MGIRDRLDRLETSLSPRHTDNRARERLEAKLAAISAHRMHRELGEEPNLEGQSIASLLGLVGSYPHGEEVPPEVAEAARSKVQELSHGPHSVAAKMVRMCLESKGYGRGD